MTLQELFDRLGQQPQYLMVFFAIIPVLAVLLGLIAGRKGGYTPWNYFYSFLIYLSSIPGIFAITLSFYAHIVQGRNVMQLDIYSQILPIVSMVLTLLIIRRQVDLRMVPGFDKLSGLLMIIFSAMVILWFLDRFHIIGFMRMRFQYVLVIFIGMLILMRYGWGKIFGSPYRSRG